MNETIKTIQSLRTIHGDFLDRKISDEDLKIILNSAVRAANASARQSYSIIVISDKDKIRAISEYNGDKLLVFCVDYTRIIDLAEHLGHKFDATDVIGFVTGCTDTVLAAQNACIAAKSLGIDSLFTQRGFHRRNIPKVIETLNLPEKNCFPILGLILGYSKNEPKNQRGRLSGKGVIHYDIYHRLTPEEREELILQYNDESLHLGLSDIPHYLDWFYAKWSKKLDDKSFIEALKKSGFLSGKAGEKQ